MFVRDPNKQTIPLILRRLVGGEFDMHWEYYAVMIFITMIPVFILFIIFQKWFIAGLAEGGIKG